MVTHRKHYVSYEETVDEFFTAIARTGVAQPYPWWGNPLGRLTLCRLAGWPTDRAMELPTAGAVVKWRIGDVIAHLHIATHTSREGVWVYLGPPPVPVAQPA